jgi:vesicle-fusing ATPase
LAATISMASEFPFVKLITPDTMIGYSESAKVNAISKVFLDSYKSPLSVIVVDGIERLLDYVPIGPRFSNSVLQTLLVLLRKTPPNDRKLLILATTSQKNLLSQMDMEDVFDAEIHVPNITELRSVSKVLEEIKLFSDTELQKSMEFLHHMGLDGRLSIGIKKLLMICEMARQDVDKVEKFCGALHEECLPVRGGSHDGSLKLDK